MVLKSRESINAAMAEIVPWTSMEQHGEKIYAETALNFPLTKWPWTAMELFASMDCHACPASLSIVQSIKQS